jgi:hypothetical protein
VINHDLINQLISFSQDGVVLTPEDIARARHARFKDTIARNPKFTLGIGQTSPAMAESSLCSMALGDEDGNVRIDWLKEWLENERLPTELGWKPASPAHGLGDALKFIKKYTALARQNNAVDKLPITFPPL